MEEHWADKIEPIPCSNFAMNKEFYEEYDNFIAELDISDALLECGSGDIIEEGDCMEYYFSKIAQPLCDFDVGELVVFNYSLEYVVDDGEVFVSLRRESPRILERRGISAHYPYREILQKVNWKEVNLPFYAWDVGLAEGPVDD
jgi:hypothetical protein